MKEIKVGMKIQGYDSLEDEFYHGIICFIDGCSATVKRDDRKTGDGEYIEGYGHGWSIMKKPNGHWGGNMDHGEISKLKKYVQARLK